MAEKEYIERNALIAEYDRVHIGPPGGARKLMVEAPAADVAEVKHGEWYVTEYEYLNCSICGEAMYTGCNSTQEANLLKDHWKSYCPNCGAKMDGGKKNDVPEV